MTERDLLMIPGEVMAMPQFGQACAPAGSSVPQLEQNMANFTEYYLI
jgi:hypothetical protein